MFDCGNGKPGHHTGGSNPPDAIRSGKPDITIRPRRDQIQTAMGYGKGKLGQYSGRGHLPNPASSIFGKPQVTIRPCRDTVGISPTWRKRERGNHARRSNVLDLIEAYGEPQVAIRPRCDRFGGSGIRNGRARNGKLSHDASWSNPPDFVARIFGE